MKNCINRFVWCISGRDSYDSRSLFSDPYAFLRTQLKRTSQERSGNTRRTHHWTEKTWDSWSQEYDGVLPEDTLDVALRNVCVVKPAW